ncbi:MAG: hypothetical protein QOF21_238 [Actinomycetota bacterium]
MDMAHVAALVETIDKVPPIIVSAGTTRVVDGVHRVTAARQAGRATIDAYFFEGEEVDAFAEAVASNIAHGRPLSLNERSAAARRLIADRPEWSDRKVSEICGLSPGTIGKLRRSTDESTQSNARMGRDGRVRPNDPAAIRLEIARALSEDLDQPVRKIAALVHASPATVLDVRNRLRRGADPVPTKLRPTTEQPAYAAADSPPTSGPWRDDRALSEEPSLRGFVAWFEAVSVGDAAWQPFVARLPVSRAYEIADEASRRAASWQRFAALLEERARRRGHP